MPPNPTAQDSDAPPRNATVRWFGHWQLLQLLGKSELTMAWRVADPRSQQELMLVLPRSQLADAAALERWQQGMRQTSRLNHPQLASVVDSGVQDGWPFVAYDPRDCSTLTEKLPSRGMPGVEAVALVTQVLQGLAYAHEAGLSHHDLQAHLVLVSDTGQVRLAGLGVAAEASRAPASDLRKQRHAAERDVLAVGLLLQLMLTGQPALDERDIGRVIARLPPWSGEQGREFVRLPWTTAHPVAEPLRAIANRATDRQERQRYRSARTLLSALEGWITTDGTAGGGPLALLADRLRHAGVLPGAPGTAYRASKLAAMERERTNELADVVLEDPAWAFELLRSVNTAQVRGGQVSGNGPVLTVRRAIAMLGLDAVRRAASVLRPWPGPLSEEGAAELERLLQRCKRAGRVALQLRPAGYDGEVIYLITLMQNLGRLVVHYHFPDEAAQIRRLTLPAPPQREGEPEDPGMTEESASFAVLGADVEAIGAAVARQWGLDESVLALIRRLPMATPPRGLEGDDDILRTVASCANEAVDALALPAPRVAAALHRVVARYGRALAFGVKELQAALQAPIQGPVGGGGTRSGLLPLADSGTPAVRHQV